MFQIFFWSAVFHSVSAFCTAGFSLFSSGFENYVAHPGMNLVIAALSYLGGIGFIVWVDLWKNFLGVRHQMTFTSKVIIYITLWFLFLGTLLFFLVEPSIQSLPAADRLLASFFQVMSASTTVGFNTLPIGKLSEASVLLIVVLMIFGASPSGTGGGLKSTTLSAVLGLIKSTLKGRDSIRFLKREIPRERLHLATASFCFYFIVLGMAVFLLLLTEGKTMVSLLFEAASALGTVGLSMGITGELTPLGKMNIILLMLMGRVGLLTFGIAVSAHDESLNEIKDNELIVS